MTFEKRYTNADKSACFGFPAEIKKSILLADDGFEMMEGVRWLTNRNTDWTTTGDFRKRCTNADKKYVFWIPAKSQRIRRHWQMMCNRAANQARRSTAGDDGFDMMGLRR